MSQIPDERIAWRSLAGTPNDGEVSFQPLSGLNEPPLTRVTLKMIYDQNGWVAAEADLERGPPPLVPGLQLGDLAQQALHDPVLLDAIQNVRVEFRKLVHRPVDDAPLTAERLLQRLPVRAGDRQRRHRGARGSVGVRVAAGTGTTFSFVLPT